jgi:hypothetical protein
VAPVRDARGQHSTRAQLRTHPSPVGHIHWTSLRVRPYSRRERGAYSTRRRIATRAQVAREEGREGGTLPSSAPAIERGRSRDERTEPSRI